MKILVVVPVKNNLHYTQSLVNDIKRSDNNGLVDMLIVDNLSTDGTGEWCRGNNLSVIDFVGQKCVIYEMWNIGLKYAKEHNYEYVGILNNDIRLPIEWWDKCKNIFRNEKIFGICPVFTFGEFKQFKSPINSYIKPILAPYGNRGFTGFCQIYRTSIQDLVGYYDESYDLAYGDNDYARRILADKMILVYTNEFVIHHYSSQTLNMESEVKQRSKQDCLKYMNKWGIEKTDEEYIVNNFGRY